MEVLLILPVFLILLLALVEFSYMLSARSDIVEASRAGARLATLSGIDLEEIENDVFRSLGGRYGSAVQVHAQLGTYSGDEVVVAVRVPMSAAAPDLLWPVGYGLRGKQFVAETRMLKE